MVRTRSGLDTTAKNTFTNLFRKLSNEYGYTECCDAYLRLTDTENIWIPGPERQAIFVALDIFDIRISKFKEYKLAIPYDVGSARAIDWITDMWSEICKYSGIEPTVPYRPTCIIWTTKTPTQNIVETE